MVVARAVGVGPGDVIVASTRNDRGLIQQQHVAPDRYRGAGLDRLYRAVLPRLLTGDRLEYRLELRRDGRCVASLPPDGSWLTLIGAGADPDTSSPQTPSCSAGGGGEPYWDHTLTFFATCTVDLDAEVIGSTPDGYRVNFYAKQGRLQGPCIDAEELEGSEYVTVRSDGIAVLSKFATYRNADGAIIFEKATGMTDLGPDGYSRIAAGPWTGAPNVVAASTWSTAHPDWQWLNRVQTTAIGRTIAQTLRVQLDLYLLALRDR
jgi:hypothetical protein